ncbi:MAG: hypothetical protein Q9169_007862 [Polycauliona sp. 2 TL-2023]
MGEDCPPNDGTSSSLVESSDYQTIPLRLKASYFRFRTRIQQNTTGTGVSKKARWAIRDKRKFACLVEEIRQFINGLEALTDSVDIATERVTLIKEELNSLEDPRRLRLIMEASQADNEEWSDAASVALETSSEGISENGRIKDWVSALPVTSTQYEDSLRPIESAWTFKKGSTVVFADLMLSSWAGLKLAGKFPLQCSQALLRRQFRRGTEAAPQKVKTVYGIESITYVLIDPAKSSIYKIKMLTISTMVSATDVLFPFATPSYRKFGLETISIISLFTRAFLVITFLWVKLLSYQLRHHYSFFIVPEVVFRFLERAFEGPLKVMLFIRAVTTLAVILGRPVYILTAGWLISEDDGRFTEPEACLYVCIAIELLLGLLHAKSEELGEPFHDLVFDVLTALADAAERLERRAEVSRSLEMMYRLAERQ